MKYKLKPLDQLIGNTGFISHEVDEIINELSQTAYSLRSVEEMTIFLQNHQIALLSHRSNESVRVQSDQVLYFLESNFGGYLNESLLVSDHWKQKLSAKRGTFIGTIKEVLNKALSEKLLANITPLTDLDNEEGYNINQIRFVDTFWKNWQTDFNLMHDSYTEENVINFLISNNYNFPPFFKFLIGEITGELHREDNPEVQRQVLQSHAKRFGHIPVRTGDFYQKDFPPVNQLIENWLNIELKQCRKKLKAYNPQQQVIIPAPAHGHKIETSMSVAELALMFRLYNKTGVVTNNKQMEMLHAIIESFSTSKTTTIAIGSLHNKYYNIEDRTRESVKEILEKMIQALD